MNLTKIFLAMWLTVLSVSSLSAQEKSLLASDGKANHPIVISPHAFPRVQESAQNLADYLGKISGAKFVVNKGDGNKGIVVGLLKHFPDRAPGVKWTPLSDATEREYYLLKSHKKGLYILGATEQAVEHGVWDLLHRLGYRQFFPGKTWEVVPKIENLSVRVDVQESPDYYSRRIWYGFGPWDYAREPYADWCKKNRATLGIQLSTGHAYSGIIRSNQAEFDAHPEYYALVNGKRNTKNLAQLCLSNPDLRKLIVAHALRHFDAKPESDSISMEPNDGGGWCECEACRKFGSVSDRVVTLANEVAAGVNKKYPGKFVGIYAYSYHSPPPSIKVHPQVVVSVATAFIRGGYTLDELLSGWQKQRATLGIREYYSVHTWDRDLPGKSRGSNLAYLKRTIPEFHAKGGRFMSAESSDNWGPNGLGYYLASRMLWDVKEAERTEELVDDFLTRAFEEAREPMREFYRLIDGSHEHLVFDDHLGKMYRCLQRAKKMTNSPHVLARLNHLVLYSRYVDLFDRYRQARGEDRQAAFEKMIRFTYRMRQTMMVHAKAVYRDVVRRDKSVSIPDGATWNVAEAKNPWKSSQPFSEQELQQFLAEGIQMRQPAKLDFEPVHFGDDLLPAKKLNLKTDKPGSYLRGRGTQTFYTWVDKPGEFIELKITGGLIAAYRDRGNVRVKLWQQGEKETLVAEDRSVPPDGKERIVKLQSRKAGLHKITISDGGDLTRVVWPEGAVMVLKTSAETPMRVNGRWTMHFYVPKGTQKIGFFATGPGSVVNPEGKVVCNLNKGKGSYYSISVSSGQDGQLWRFQNTAGMVRLLTVPPYLARKADELLLPAEVVQKDSP